MSYYCEANPDELLTMRERNEGGPIIANAELCHKKEGVTEIRFIGDNKILQLKHGHHNLPSIHSKTTFTYGGKEYIWEGCSELYQKNGNGATLIATLYPALSSEKFGTLEVVCNGEEMSEVASITAMLLLKRVERGLEITSSS
jgi:hypothetical protein